MPDTRPAPQTPAPQTTHALLRTLAVFLAAAALYAVTILALDHTATPVNSYFDHLAQAMLRGRLHLDPPPGTHDLTAFDGRWYVPFPPLPALLMVPFVAALGIEGFSTVWFSVAVGALSVALLHLALELLDRNGVVPTRVPVRLLLSVAVGAGSLLWQTATDGTVWFVSSTCTFLMLSAATCCAAGSRSPWLSAAALAIAMWGRPHVLLSLPMLAAISLAPVWPADAASKKRALAGWLIRAAVPLGVSALGLMGHNAARFGNPLDFGYKSQKVDASLLGDLHLHGQFSTQHVMRNLRVLLLGAPEWRSGERWPRPDDRGMSLLLTSPALLLLIGLRRGDAVSRGCWLAVGLTLIPLMLYYNTGWRQFGYRFSLDFFAPLIVLLACRVGVRFSRELAALVALGVLVNAWGVVCWRTGWMAAHG